MATIDARTKSVPVTTYEEQTVYVLELSALEAKALHGLVIHVRPAHTIGETKGGAYDALLGIKEQFARSGVSVIAGSMAHVSPDGIQVSR